MFNKRTSLWSIVLVAGLCVLLIGLAGCSKKVVKPTTTGMEKKAVKSPAEDISSEQPEMNLEVADIGKEIPRESRVQVKEVIETAALKDVYFEFDKYNLTTQAVQVLTKNAEWLKDNPKVKVMVEGHCDERGTIEYNLALGQKRATSVRNFLFNLGVKADRINTI
ncbi:MAG: OmpA family protein, partial [bacterium]